MGPRDQKSIYFREVGSRAPTRHEVPRALVPAVGQGRMFNSMGPHAPLPHGGLRMLRSPPILGCYVTKFKPREALNLIVWRRVDF